MQDYYQILGVSPEASEADIRSAYRRLAMQYHPDRNPGDKAAEAKFKEINAANETLGDANRRAQYDQERQFGAMGGGTGGGPFGFGFEFGRGGGSPFDSIFEQMFGGRPFGGRPARNSDTTVALNITLEDAFRGKSIPVQFTDSAGQNVNLVVNIPAGVESGTRLRYAGNGSRVRQDLPPGDLFIIINIANHPIYERSGPHLIMHLKVDLWTLLVGGERSVTSIDGSVMQVKIPPMTSDQTALRVPNKGMPLKNGGSARGDLMVRVIMVMPVALTSEQQETITKWRLAS